MTLHHPDFPPANGDVFLTYTGMETDLIFNQGVDLPGFATYPLLETEEGRDHLRRYLQSSIELAQKAGVGVILESPTWVANRDRGATIGYTPQTLKQRNRDSIELLVSVRKTHGDVPTIISANVGPRSDAYALGQQMSASEAEHYHIEQIEILAATQADVISGYTLNYPEEAIGIVQAARRFNLPVVIAFTVELDGRLVNGQSLKQAIETVDRATDGYASYFMINCAHPDHITQILNDEPWMVRLKGVVANASRCSHAELDEAEVLDDGNPEELGEQLGEIHRAFPNITILGGCCGTDLRHLACIAKAATRG